ncbi:hypothetical protein JJV70_20255 [Streptomyces sp. JJ66]|uniref:restriction system modified-DNA reader domain-containing protein n=1 Tax=Streptomyces sp. JJ66 TaxID=2803843 RepID=UPI001C57F85F|nr:hypothetical protein [Streptomyces sp. JJ66]MBW1604392.1 hypothetical protein [Streptomyces sp. JJ66]
MRSIRVDDDVYARLQSLAEPFVDTPNSTLRRLLGLKSAWDRSQSPPRPVGRDQSLAPLVADGRLTEGQELVWRRRNLGREHRAVVLADGSLRIEDGTIHATPSGAATELAGNPQNGWVVFTTAEGRKLKELR